MRLVVVERIGPLPAPRIGLAGSGAFNPPAVIDLKGPQEDHEPSVVPEVFVPLPNDQENPFGPTFIPVGPKHHGCGKKKNVVMAKMDDLSRFFRKLFGFGPIEELALPIPVLDHAAERHRVQPGHKMMAAHIGSDEDNNTFHILPFMPGPVRSEGFPPPPPGSDNVSTSPSHRPPRHGRRDGPHHFYQSDLLTLFLCQLLCSDLRHRCCVTSKFGNLALEFPSQSA
jgi:hypothetical protein